jgi:hypothetical protein
MFEKYNGFSEGEGFCMHVFSSTFGTFTGGNLKTFIPKVESFAITSQVAEICDSGSIGFLYDCVNHVRNQFKRKTLEW